MATDVPLAFVATPSRALDLTRSARRVVALYLALTSLLLVVGRAPWSGLAVHLALLGLVLGAERLVRTRVGLLAAAVAWLPLLALPLLYAELPLLIAAGGVAFQDPAVQAWETSLFGAPARTLAAAWPNVLVSELLHAGYLSYYPLIYVPPLLLWLRGRDEAFAETLLALAITFTACCAVYVLFPVQGPRYLWPAPAGIPHGPARALAVALLEGGSSRGAAFPSSHMAVAVAQALVAFRHQRRVGVAASCCALLIGVGAVYGGFHYAVDMAAGALLGALVAGGVLARRRRLEASAPGFQR